MIGVDQDWYNSAASYKEVYLTSVLKRVDLVPYEATKAVVEGGFAGGILNFDLANSGVELADYHDQADRVSPELQAELDQVKEDLIAGALSTGWAEYIGAPPADEGMTDDAADMESVAFEWTEGLAEDGELAGIDPSGQTVVWWHNHSGGREELLNEIVAQFNEENPYGITVEPINQGGYDDIREKMGAGIVSGDLPAVVVGYQNDEAFYADVDALVDMDKFVNDPHWGLSEAEIADFSPGIFEQDVHPEFEGMRLGFPPNRSMEVLYVNRTWLEELGYDPEVVMTPELFEEIACAAAEDKGDGTGGYIVRTDASQVASGVLARGGNVLNEAGDGYNYNSPELKDYFEQIKGMYDNGCAWISPEDFHDAEFATRQAIFYAGSTSGLPFTQGSMDDAGNTDEWGIAPQPYTTAEPVQNLYGGSVMIPIGPPEQELAAWIFVDWFTSPQAQAEWVKASNYFSPRLSVGPLLTDYIESNPKYADALEMIPYAGYEPQLISYNEVRNAVTEVFNQILTDDLGIDQAMADLDEEANQIHQEATE
jgi:multiple sugar transport system substrate-binding protein/sn-glycerol 3-phosphate transport system substrate-binding protein